MKLDWDKPYGILCGVSPVPGAKYEQNGKYFSTQGVYIPETEKERKVAEKAAEKAIDEARELEIIEREAAAIEQEDRLKAEAEAAEKLKEEPVPEPVDDSLPNKEELEAALAKGMTHTDIAKVWGCTRQKITRLVKDLGLDK